MKGVSCKKSHHDFETKDNVRLLKMEFAGKDKIIDHLLNTLTNKDDLKCRSQKCKQENISQSQLALNVKKREQLQYRLIMYFEIKERG